MKTYKGFNKDLTCRGFQYEVGKEYEIEGGIEIEDSFKAILSAGIPIMGHLGLTPQSINKFGTFAVRAREDAEAEKLVRDAHLLEEGRKYIDGMNNPYILNVYWEDIMKSTLDRVQECSELKEYFTKFYQKYIEILKNIQKYSGVVLNRKSHVFFIITNYN